MKKHMVMMTLALISAGCGSTVNISRLFAVEKPIEVQELRRSQQCGTGDAAARVQLFPDLAAVQAWEKSRNLSLTVGADALPQGPYALVEVGRRSTAGYGLAISRAAGRRGEVLMLKGTFITPVAGTVVAQVVTSPCVLVSLPPRDYTAVEVLDQTGERRASTDQAVP